MEQYQNVVQDLAGNVVPQASIRVLLANGGNATLYDASGTTTSNPVPCDAEGYVSFLAANGDYYPQVEVAGKLYKKLGKVTLYDAADDNSRVTLAQLMAPDIARQLGFRVTQYHFGAVGDGVADDTAALNAWAAFFMGGNDPRKQFAAHGAAGKHRVTIDGWRVQVGDYMPNLTTDGADQFRIIGTGSTLLTIETTGGSGQLPTAEWQGIGFDGVAGSTNTLVKVKGACFFTGRGWHFYRAGTAVNYVNEKAGSFTEGVVFEDAYIDTSVRTGIRYSKVSGDGSFRSSGFRNFKWNFSGVAPGVLIDAGCVPYMAPLSGTLWNYGANSIFIRNNSSQVPFIGVIDTETQGANTNKLTMADPAGSGYTFFIGNLAAWGYVSGNINLGLMVITTSYLNSVDGFGQMFQPDTVSGRVVSTATGQRLKVPLLPGVSKGFLQWSAIITMNVTAPNGYYFTGMYTVRNGSSDNIINISAMAGNGILNNAGTYGAITESQGNDYSAWFDNPNLPAGAQLAYSVKYLNGLIAT